MSTVMRSTDFKAINRSKPSKQSTMSTRVKARPNAQIKWSVNLSRLMLQWKWGMMGQNNFFFNSERLTRDGATMCYMTYSWRNFFGGGSEEHQEKVAENCLKSLTLSFSPSIVLLQSSMMRCFTSARVIVSLTVVSNVPSVKNTLTFTGAPKGDDDGIADEAKQHGKLWCSYNETSQMPADRLM